MSKTNNSNNTLSETSWTITSPPTFTESTMSIVNDLIDLDEPHDTKTTKQKHCRPSQKPVNWNEPREVARIRSIFAHPTKYDLLTDQSADTVNYNTSISEYSLLFTSDDKTNAIIEEKIEEGRLIPRFDNEFWKAYGNRLRVFGTVEEVCNLNTGLRIKKDD